MDWGRAKAARGAHAGATACRPVAHLGDGLVRGATLRDCPFCGKSRPAVLVRLPAKRFCAPNSTYRPDFARILEVAEDALFPIVECQACRFVYSGHLPSAEFLDRVYDVVIDPQRGWIESMRPDWIGHQLRLGGLLLQELVDVFGNEGGLALLDFGCGYGTLVQALSGPRIRCVGFETSRRRLDLLRAHQLPAWSTLQEVTNAGPYHGIVLSDVLEHVPAPREVLVLCHQLLVAEGLLCVNVPHFDRRQLGPAASGRDFPRTINPWEHLNYFTPESLGRLVVETGFTPLEPRGTVDLGVRPGLRGLRRIANCLGAALRLCRYAVGVPPTATTVIAQKH